MSPSVEALNILLNANDTSAVHPATFEELGEAQKVRGVVYEDGEGDFWTWRDEWRAYDPDHPSWGWYRGSRPSSTFGPYVKTSLYPHEVK